ERVRSGAQLVSVSGEFVDDHYRDAVDLQAAPGVRSDTRRLGTRHDRARERASGGAPVTVQTFGGGCRRPKPTLRAREVGQKLFALDLDTVAIDRQHALPLQAR